MVNYLFLAKEKYTGTIVKVCGIRTGSNFRKEYGYSQWNKLDLSYKYNNVYTIYNELNGEYREVPCCDYVEL